MPNNLASLQPGAYVTPDRSDPSSYWRNYMIRRDPGFTDPGPRPPPTNASVSTTTTAPPASTGTTGTTADGPVVVGSGTPEVFPEILPGQQIGGMHPLRWLELYRGVPIGSLGGPLDE